MSAGLGFHERCQAEKQPQRPTAFLCVNDCVALGVIRAAAAMGLRIPHDLSVVGFDDEEAAALVTPALTSVKTPMTDIGQQSVRQLMIDIQHPRPAQKARLHRKNGATVDIETVCGSLQIAQVNAV